MARYDLLSEIGHTVGDETQLQNGIRPDLIIHTGELHHPTQATTYIHHETPSCASCLDLEAIHG